MKFNVGDEIQIIDPVPTHLGKWGMSGSFGVVKEASSKQVPIVDDFLIDRRPQYAYTLELWPQFIPDSKFVEQAVPESIIEFRK